MKIIIVIIILSFNIYCVHYRYKYGALLSQFHCTNRIKHTMLLDCCRTELKSRIRERERGQLFIRGNRMLAMTSAFYDRVAARPCRGLWMFDIGNNSTNLQNIVEQTRLSSTEKRDKRMRNEILCAIVPWIKERKI